MRECCVILRSNEMSRVLSCVFAVVLLMLSLSAQAQQTNGKLVVEFKDFTSEIKLKKKVETTLKSGGMEWGVKDGLVVFSMVNKRFVNFDMPNFTRYGGQTALDVPAGNYNITGIGLKPKTAFSPEKLLDKGAYFNENIMSFTVQPGKTTTISIRPIIQKNATFFLNIYLPELLTSIVTEESKTEEVSIVERNDKSVDWSVYSGPLKFVVKK
jgi:hypothetical protein